MAEVMAVSVHPPGSTDATQRITRDPKTNRVYVMWVDFHNRTQFHSCRLPMRKPTEHTPNVCSARIAHWQSPPQAIRTCCRMSILTGRSPRALISIPRRAIAASRESRTGICLSRCPRGTAYRQRTSSCPLVRSTPRDVQVRTHRLLVRRGRGDGAAPVSPVNRRRRGHPPWRRVVSPPGRARACLAHVVLQRFSWLSRHPQ